MSSTTLHTEVWGKDMFGEMFLLLVAVVFSVIGLFSINTGRTAEVRHHHSIGYGLGCGWVFFVAGILAAGLALSGLRGGR